MAKYEALDTARERIKKYVAIVANLALWGIQSAMDGTGEHDQ